MKSVLGDQNKPHRNDPVLINPKGMEIQVPEERVVELLKRGYRLKDPNWRTSGQGRPKVSLAPFSRERLEEEIAKELDNLDVIIV